MSKLLIVFGLQIKSKEKRRKKNEFNPGPTFLKNFTRE
jgi:hypothetical protein